MYDYLSSKLMALSSFSLDTTYVDSNLLYSNNSWTLFNEKLRYMLAVSKDCHGAWGYQNNQLTLQVVRKHLLTDSALHTI